MLCNEIRAAESGLKHMLDQTQNATPESLPVLGDLSSLAEQLGAKDSLAQLPLAAAMLEASQIRSLPALEAFVDQYRSGVLIPHELPAIARAYGHAARFEVRELIALDNSMAHEPALATFASASHHVGRTQLRRLRPLRGERLVKRYLDAIEAQQASGWHTLVFGMVLALYSMPLRQGLVHYAQQTLATFVQAANARLELTEPVRQKLLAAQWPPVLSAVQELIDRDGFELR